MIFFKNFKITGQILFVTVLIFFSTLQARNLEKFERAGNIADYFSGVILLNESKYKDSYKYLKKLDGLEQSHLACSSKYLLSLVNSGNLVQAVNFSKKLEKEGKLSIKTPCQLESIEGDKDVKSISIKFDDGKIEEIETDIILSFFGLVMKLGPIAEWGLNMSKKTIEVNSENFETNKKGIFAVGDICSYPGKLKLILSGFHEVALASVECFKRARPNEKYRFEFTTSSKAIQERLGKK